MGFSFRFVSGFGGREGEGGRGGSLGVRPVVFRVGNSLRSVFRGPLEIHPNAATGARGVALGGPL